MDHMFKGEKSLVLFAQNNLRLLDGHPVLKTPAKKLNLLKKLLDNCTMFDDFPKVANYVINCSS